MITADQLKEIGIFRKTHGLQGELNATLEVDPAFVEEGYPLFVELDGVFVPFYPESTRPKGTASELIKLEDVDFDMANNMFVNAPFYALKSQLAEFFDMEEDDLLTEDELIGFLVTKPDGTPIGKVAEIDDSTINTLLVMESPVGENIYLPFVDEFIREIDPTRQLIIADPPEGLLTLNDSTPKDI